MVKNALAARDLPQTPLGELTASPDPLAELRKGWEKEGGDEGKGKRGNRKRRVKERKGGKGK